ncbi:hypothetical protein [Frankia sp. Cas4]|uniref:hypothetical protein n=1 Tax=Frankia sp. Cas4 TaxID=3073927 RepID=UPI002AD3E330|nr:hypothetical protein [Frankia sp. Cas4]
MIFNGLEPWRDNFPKVDFQTPSGLVDLHNNAILEKISFLVADVTLVLGFRYSGDWRKIESSGRPVDLEFGDIANLRITQIDGYDTRSGSTLEGVTRDIQSEESRFIVDVGDVKCEFNTQSVTLRMR